MMATKERHEDGQDNSVSVKPSFMEKLADTLYKYRKLSAFSVGGRADNMPNDPNIEVDGVGQVQFPVNVDTADKIISACEKAPHGKGMETVIDENVRKTWQLNPSKFTINNPIWNEGMKKLLNKIGEQLGFRGSSVEARLYKFLLYEKGSHFKVHRDSEKSPGMFATLIVQLPSAYEGGELLYHHDDLKEKYDFSQWGFQRRHKIFYAAHFSDVEHEIKKIKKGYRCVLVYNLCWKEFSEEPNSPVTFNDEITSLLLNEWKFSPEALVFPLNHLYSYTGFTREKDQRRLGGVSSLKGFDAILAAALKHSSMKFQADDELSLYICNAKKVKERNCGYFGYTENRQWIHGNNGSSASLGSEDEKPKYLREKDPAYLSDFDHMPMVSCQTFDGEDVCFPECFQLNLENCLIAHTFESEKFWKKAQTERFSWTGNEGPGIREIFHHTVIVAIRKSEEEEKIRLQGNLEHILDYYQQKRGTPGFKEYFVSEMKWLMENWEKKLSLVRPPRDTFEDFWSIALMQIISRLVDRILHMIADLELSGVFLDFLNKITTTPTRYSVSYSPGGLRLCLQKLPIQVIKDGLLKLFARSSSMFDMLSELLFFDLKKSEILACIQQLEVIKRRDSSAENFHTYCKAIVEVMECDIAFINDSFDLMREVKELKSTLPIIAEDFPRRVIQVKSTSAFYDKWVYLIKKLAEAGASSIAFLVEAAVPGLRENSKTNPEDLIEFIQLLQEVKPKTDVKQFINHVTTSKSANGDCIEFIKLLVNNKLGDISQLIEIAIPGFVKNIKEMRKPVILEMFDLLRKDRQRADIQRIAKEVASMKALSKPRKYCEWEWDCFRLIKSLADADLAEFSSLVQSALPGFRENIKLMETSDIVEVMDVLLKGDLHSELKEFSSVIVEKINNAHKINCIFDGCMKRFGEVTLEKDELQTIVTWRVKWLEECINELKFPWCIPNACYRKHPQVEEFLKGPEEIMYYDVYDKYEHAAKFVQDFRSKDYIYGVTATASVGMQGTKQCIIIKKTKEYYAKRISDFQTKSDELARMKQFISEN